MFTRVQDEVIDVSKLRQEFHPDDFGGLVIFEGVVRKEENGNKLHSLHYESYREMAESQMLEIVRAAVKKYGLVDAGAVHRIGDLLPGEPSVVVFAFSMHRKEAFRACEDIIDQIKERVPIWKKDVMHSGKDRWHD